MRKRNRDIEPGSRPVECFYCPQGSPKVPFNLLPRHTKNTHGAKNLFPPRTKDATPIQDFFAKKNKKPKVEKAVIQDSQGSNSQALFFETFPASIVFYHNNSKRFSTPYCRKQRAGGKAPPPPGRSIKWRILSRTGKIDTGQKF